LKIKLGTAINIGQLIESLSPYSGGCVITPIELEYASENGEPARVNIKLFNDSLTLGQVKAMMVDPYDDVESADKVLIEWNEVAIENSIDYVLVCGTCLGFYRDGGYIKGDNDIDICINPKDLERTVKVLKERGFRLGRRGGSQHFMKNNILLDAWLKPHFEPPYAYVQYKGKLYPIPHDIDRYLTALYGDWRTPSGQSAKEAVFARYK